MSTHESKAVEAHVQNIINSLQVGISSFEYIY